MTDAEAAALYALLNEARNLLREWIGERQRFASIKVRTAEFVARTKDLL